MNLKIVSVLVLVVFLSGMFIPVSFADDCGVTKTDIIKSIIAHITQRSDINRGQVMALIKAYLGSADCSSDDVREAKEKADNVDNNVIPRCSDGTLFAHCSFKNKPKYCYNGRMVNRCDMCCESSRCGPDGRCEESEDANDAACTGSGKPRCCAIGSRSEGWYQDGKLIKWDNCKGCYAICKAVGSRPEGWYSSCNNKLIKWENCGETVCGNGICELGETPENCPEDCKACAKEGESIPVIPNPPKCCKGLKLIKPKSPDIIGTSGICTAKCGNGICDVETETNYNCPEDCKEPSEPKFKLTCKSTYTTNWHLGKCHECKEGYVLANCETRWIVSKETCEKIYETECLENPKCGQGDEEIGIERCDDEDVCGNNICETGEDSYNCPQDCSATAGCTDTDGGNNIYEKGTTCQSSTKVSVTGGSNLFCKTDECVSSTSLKEYYCNGDTMASKTITCSDGCVGGACKEKEVKVETICTDRVDNDGDGLIDNEDGDCWSREPVFIEDFDPLPSFKELEAFLPSLKESGIKTIELQGIFEHCTSNHHGYRWQVRNYFKLDPARGTRADLESFLAQAHRLDMKVIPLISLEDSTPPKFLWETLFTTGLSGYDKDGIGGHFYRYQMEHPEKQILLKNLKGNFACHPYGWGYAVDCSSEDVAIEWEKIFKHLLVEIGFDGLRVDSPSTNYCHKGKAIYIRCKELSCPDPVEGEYSSLPLYRRLKEMLKPDQVFISEGPSTRSAHVKWFCEFPYYPPYPDMDEIAEVSEDYGFTPILLRIVLSGEGPVQKELEEVLFNTVAPIEEKIGSEYLVNWVNKQYAEQVLHDRERFRFVRNWNYLEVPLFKFISTDGRYFPAVTLTSTIRGVPKASYYELFGHPDEENYFPNFPNTLKMRQTHWEKILNLRNNNNALKYGLIENVWKSGDNTYAYLREYEDEKAIVVINFLDKEATSYLDLSFFPKGTVLYDWLNGEEFIVDAPGNFKISIPKYGSRILTIKQEPVCGNNICETGETPENCPEDCKEPSEPKFKLTCKSTHTMNWHYGKCHGCEEEGYVLAKCETILIWSRETCEKVYETECLENPECGQGDEETGRERCDDETSPQSDKTSNKSQKEIEDLEAIKERILSNIEKEMMLSVGEAVSESKNLTDMGNSEDFPKIGKEMMSKVIEGITSGIEESLTKGLNDALDEEFDKALEDIEKEIGQAAAAEAKKELEKAKKEMISNVTKEITSQIEGAFSEMLDKSEAVR